MILVASFGDRYSGTRSRRSLLNRCRRLRIPIKTTLYPSGDEYVLVVNITELHLERLTHG